MIFVRGDFIMKKFINIVFIFLCIFIFSSCKINLNCVGQIKQRTLTKEETNVLKLMGLDDKSKIYDYNVDKGAKAIYVNLYFLDENLKWENNGGIGANLDSFKGTIGILKDESERLQVSLEEKNGISMFKSNSDLYLDADKKIRSIWWNDKADIEHEKEIPLAIQVITKSTKVMSFSGESFYEPERLKGHDAVIALTVKFSKNEIE